MQGDRDSRPNHPDSSSPVRQTDFALLTEDAIIPRDRAAYSSSALTACIARAVWEAHVERLLSDAPPRVLRPRSLREQATIIMQLCDWLDVILSRVLSTLAPDLFDKARRPGPRGRQTCQEPWVRDSLWAVAALVTIVATSSTMKPRMHIWKLVRRWDGGKRHDQVG